MLTLLKCLQRLGYFVFLSSVPRSIPEHIAKLVRCRCSLKIQSFYDDARDWTSHIKRLRAYLNIKPADKKARSTALKAMEHAACLAPYRKANINRFGAYFLDEIRDAINIEYRLPVVSLSN